MSAGFALASPTVAWPLLTADGPPAFALGRYPFWIAIVLMMIGFYTMVRKRNLIKKVIGAGIFQTSVFLFYLSIGKVGHATAPILWEDGARPDQLAGAPYENPLPHVLMLTGIVVGVATMAVALALVVRIYDAFGTIEEEELLEMRR